MTTDDQDNIDALAEKGRGDRSDEREQDHDEVPQELLEKIPEPVRNQVRETFGIISSGSMGNPLASKVTAEHIDKLIDYGEAESRREHASKEKSRIFGLIYVLIALGAFFLFALMFARTEPEIFKLVLTYLGTFGAGFAGGWGIKAARGRQEE